jgi:hypothetical protein
MTNDRGPGASESRGEVVLAPVDELPPALHDRKVENRAAYLCVEKEMQFGPATSRPEQRAKPPAGLGVAASAPRGPVRRPVRRAAQTRRACCRDGRGEPSSSPGERASAETGVSAALQSWLRRHWPSPGGRPKLRQCRWSRLARSITGRRRSSGARCRCVGCVRAECSGRRRSSSRITPHGTRLGGWLSRH